MDARKPVQGILMATAVFCGLGSGSPCIDTGWFLGDLAAVIQEYYERENKYPESLAAACWGGTQYAVWYELCRDAEDAWGRRIVYVKHQDTYELFSLGWDGLAYTFDDVYPGPAGCGAPPEVRIEERGACYDAQKGILVLQEAIRNYRYVRGEFPKSLMDLTIAFRGKSFLYHADALQDPWGEPYVYLRRPAGGVTVISKGPDRRQGTVDDVYESGIAEGCTRALAPPDPATKSAPRGLLSGLLESLAEFAATDASSEGVQPGNERPLDGEMPVVAPSRPPAVPPKPPSGCGCSFVGAR